MERTSSQHSNGMLSRDLDYSGSGSSGQQANGGVGGTYDRQLSAMTPLAATKVCVCVCVCACVRVWCAYVGRRGRVLAYTL
jgi:hypothetical protein